MKYDYLIVGAGLFGAVFARGGHGREGRPAWCWTGGTTSGETFTPRRWRASSAPVRGPIFSTLRTKNIWDYINRYAQFNSYINSPVAVYRDELYNLPL